jgi:membrane protein implicated in regulation of membrane protease activity
MPDWVWWLIAAGVLGLAELHTVTLVLGMLAIAAVAGALAGVAGAPAAIQVLTFAVASALALLVVRPIAARHRRTPLALRTGTAALVGKRGTTVSAVDAMQGLVRIGGEVWTARTYDECVVPAGAPVDVVEIDGATAVVLPINPINEHASPKEHP